MLSDNRGSARKPGINIVSNGDGALVSLHGRVDFDSSPDIRVRLLAFFETSRSRMASIDLSGVTHFDSSGIATLIEALKVARNHRTEVRLQGLHHQLIPLFEVSGVLTLFDGSTQG